MTGDDIQTRVEVSYNIERRNVFFDDGCGKRRRISEFDLNLELEGTFTFLKVIALADERMEPLILRECKRVAA